MSADVFAMYNLLAKRRSSPRDIQMAYTQGPLHCLDSF